MVRVRRIRVRVKLVQYLNVDPSMTVVSQLDEQSSLWLKRYPRKTSWHGWNLGGRVSGWVTNKYKTVSRERYPRKTSYRRFWVQVRLGRFWVGKWMDG